ncbi:hypothetical protein GCM10010417_05850 [Streptomyces carpaticus]
MTEAKVRAAAAGRTCVRWGTAREVTDLVPPEPTMSTSPAPATGGPAAPDTPPAGPGAPAPGEPAPGLLIIGSGADDAPVCDADGVCAL